MVLVRYLGVEDGSNSEADDLFPKLRYDGLRPRAVQLPSYLDPVIREINSDVLPPSPSQVEEWAQLLINALSKVDRDAVCKSTQEQSSSPTWYKERICRLPDSIKLWPHC